MLKFKIIEELKPNDKIFNIIKDFKYKVIKDKVKTLLHIQLILLFQNTKSIKLITNHFISKSIMENIILKKYYKF